MVSGKSLFFALVSAFVLSACGQPQAARPYVMNASASDQELLVTPQTVDVLAPVVVPSAGAASGPVKQADASSPADPSAEARHYIRTMFLVWPGREPSAGEMSLYIVLWQQGLPLNAIGYQIAGMPESKIRGYYLMILNREADQAGMDFWVGQLKAGVPLSEIEAAFRAAVGR